MSHESELRRLEQFVEKLLAGFTELRAEKARLLEELGERELQIEELRANLSSKEIERSEISQRVSKIVEQIEEWETGLTDDAVDVTEPEAVEEIVVSEEDEVPLDSDLSQERRAASERRGEEEGRVQQNLFSIGLPTGNNS